MQNADKLWKSVLTVNYSLVIMLLGISLTVFEVAWPVNC